MATYRNPKYKHTITAEDHETTKRAIMARAGWVIVPEVATPYTIATASSSLTFATDEPAAIDLRGLNQTNEPDTPSIITFGATDGGIADASDPQVINKLAYIERSSPKASKKQ